MIKKIRIGARPSKLAIKQVEEIISKIDPIDFDIIIIETKGDRDKKTSLAGQEFSDFFTYEIEQKLIYGEIDIAIHSAKDLELAPPKELIIAAMTASISPFEALVSKENLTLAKLYKDSVVGTSSVNRKSAINRYRPDLIVKDIRGNVDERISQLDSGRYDAIVVAHAALLRLDLEDRVSEIISKDIIDPHPLQGRLAIQTRHGREDLIEIFRGLDEK